MANNNLVQTIINAILAFINKQFPGVTPQPTVAAPQTPSDPQLDWTNAQSMVSKYFSVQNAILLHDWNRLATPQDGYDPARLLAFCAKLDQVRELIGSPMNIHCIFRSQEYNAEHGFKPTADVHSMSIACDFDCAPNLTIDQIKEILEPQLEALEIRMEFGTTTWVHVDIHAPGPSGRYFHV